MLLSERDHISFHEFLRTLREKNQVFQVHVCKGICTKSAMTRFENGSRIPNKLMRDRFTARLGISCEKYEEYLQPKEYVRWEQRIRIVKAIEERKLKQAKEELEAYAMDANHNCINLQFVDAMRYMILRLEGAPREILWDVLCNAVKHTVPNVKKALAGEHLLCDQEINLIAEMISLDEPKVNDIDVNAWRITAYEKLLAYIEASCWEDIQKAKVYPKIERQICQSSQKKEEWSDFGYLYYENDCYDISQVIESRRKMFGLSRRKVTEGICAERTLVRIEQEGMNPSLGAVRHMFERIGLCPEYRRARVLTNDVEVLLLADEVIRNKNHSDFEKWEEKLKELESRLCMEIPQNKQEVSYLCAMLMYQRGDIGKEEFCRRLRQALAYTLPPTALEVEEEMHLTKSERTILGLLEMEKN